MPSQVAQFQSNSQVHSTAGSPAPPPVTANGLFTPAQSNMLRNQMLAFKSLYKTKSLPPQVQQSLFAPNTQQQAHTPIPPVNDSVNSIASQSPKPATPPSAHVVASPEPPVTTLAKLGVSGYVAPESLIPAFDLTDMTEAASYYIPSLMPNALDFTAVKNKREAAIADAIFNRIVELASNITEIPADSDISGASKELNEVDEKELDKLIELKSLKLLNKQKALRGDVVADIYFFNSVAMNEGNQIHFTRMKQLTAAEADVTEQFDMQQRSERAKRENQEKRDYLKGICSHSSIVHKNYIVKRDRTMEFGKLIRSAHFNIEKEEQKKAERMAKQRLQALKANDEEAYIKLLDQTKDTRITHLLKQTNSFLGSLTAKVRSQQDYTKSIAMPTVRSDKNGKGDEDGDDADYYEVAHKIKEVITKQPSILVGGTLKEYQLKGLQWMISLYNNNLNGILADEMGLGKTVQSISLITYLIEVKLIPGPYLIIVPLSTLTNWTLEFERWAPSVKKIVYKGPPQTRKALQNQIRAGDFQVLLTTFEYIIRDKAILSKIKWVHMIIDEGHRMKNTQSKLSATLTQFYITKYRLILTGTPLQNDLPELWALLNFVLPKIFNSVKSFDEWFNTPFANTGGQEKMDLSEEETLLVIRRLHKVLRPFLLRRLKKDVEKDLPDKVEKVIKCKMSALQASVYQQVLKFKKTMGGTGSKGLNNTLMQLRKVCNHPFVFEEVENQINPDRLSNDLLWRTAGKFELLDRVIPKFQATNHRILIFFQMTQIMDIMEDFMRMRGVQYLRLDGGTKADERTDMLQKFNAPESPYFAFLLSTRAGGLGLNLQTADTVIIYDTDWNPHQDLQAQDRAHRIGQTKEVRILRLITENSVEETILDRAHKKLDIDGKVIQAGKFDNKSTSEEQEAFLRSLLEQEEAKRLNKNDEDEELDDDELNEILARSDDERILFGEIDRDRNANSRYGKNERLFQEKELPHIYTREYLMEAEQKQAEPDNDLEENYGRGARERKITHYDDGLTEEQWLDAIEDANDSIESATARKRARQQKRIAVSPSLSDTPSSPGGKRKRGKKSKTPSTPIGEPPKKKGKGRPPKIKETLTPDKRAELTNQMKTLYDLVLSAEDPEEPGRLPVEIFLELPSKKLYPDYYILIKTPVACDVISKKIGNNVYQSLDEFRTDFKQMFDNARIYNEEGSQVVEDANYLQNLFNQKVNEMVPGMAVRSLVGMDNLGNSDPKKEEEFGNGLEEGLSKESLSQLDNDNMFKDGW